MSFQISGALLDACVLGVVNTGDTYGYDLTQRLQSKIGVSESTLYPVMRRLLKEGMLHTYDMAYAGRNRRYYSITENGRAALNQAIINFEAYCGNIKDILKGEVGNDTE
jgi:PadR family transcriptional regulator PadR